MAADSLSLKDARRIALAAQGFGVRQARGQASWRRMRQAIDRRGTSPQDCETTPDRPRNPS